MTVTTTDPQGKPVAAELSLAMIEQSLLERFASPLPAIGDFFRGAERQPAVRCTSSITFSYWPATQPINPRLLAEKDREEIAHEEAESRRMAIAAARTEFSSSHAALQTDAPPAANLGAAGYFLRIDAGINTSPNADGTVEYGQYMNDAVQESALGSDTIRSFQTMGRRQNILNRNGAGGFNFNQQAALQGFGGEFGANPSANQSDQKHIFSFFVGFHDGNGDESGKVYPAADLVLPITQQGNNTYTLQLNGGNTYTGGTNITGGDLNSLIVGNGALAIVNNSGMYRNLRLGDGKLDPKRAAAMAAEFNSSGAILLSALLPQETGYWNPVVTTGEDGTAKLTLTVPERSTAWKFLAKVSRPRRWPVKRPTTSW